MWVLGPAGPGICVTGAGLCHHPLLGVGFVHGENGYPSPSPACRGRSPATPISPASPTGRPVSPEHGTRRSRGILAEPALTRPAKLTASETHRLDGAVVAISVNPELGTKVPGSVLCDYVDEIDGVRVIYYVTALRQITIVAYVEA